VHKSELYVLNEGDKTNISMLLPDLKKEINRYVFKKIHQKVRKLRRIWRKNR